MIRQMETEDVEACVALGRKMHKESRYKNISWRDQTLVDLGFSCCWHRDVNCGLVEEKDGKIIGLFVGQITPYFFGPDKIAQDLILFVEKKYRGGTTAFKLLKAYEDWAIRNGAREIMLGVSTGVNEKRTVALYKRLGYKLSGTILKKKK